MRIHLVDPPAYTPPYDRALASALARRGHDVALVTSRFRHGDVPPAPGVAVQERFYGRLSGVARAARHVPDMLRYARRARREADVVHFQWLSVQEADALLLPPRAHPRVLTAHDVLPREGRPTQRLGQRLLYARMDAVVVHSRHGRDRLVDEAGVDPGRVHVIPHGALTHLRDFTPRRPPELPVASRVPVVLCFGLMRPYKGIDVLQQAWTGLQGAELWLVGAPRGMEAPRPRGGVRVVPRFVTEAEAAWCFEQASLVVLPYREIDQSGVLSTALGLGKPLVLSDAGGFPEVEAAEVVRRGDAGALHGTLARLIADASARDRLAARSRALAEGAWSWDAVAAEHEALYRRLAR